MANSKRWDLNLKKKAEEFGLELDFVKAIVKAESNGNTLVVRYEPKWK